MMLKMLKKGKQQILYTIVNERNQFMGLEYKMGVNELQDIKLDVGKNGYLINGFVLYKESDLPRVFQNGVNILQIVLHPIDKKEHDKYQYYEGPSNIITTRPIVVLSQENLLDPDIVKKYKLPECNYYMAKLALLGGPESIDLLNKWASRDKLYYDGYAIANACCRGHVDVLDWFKNNGLKNSTVKGAGPCLYHAKLNGHTHVLEWASKSGYDFI
jgi:hypothetical protein